jgi:hypothetical protein
LSEVRWSIAVWLQQPGLAEVKTGLFNSGNNTSDGLHLFGLYQGRLSLPPVSGMSHLQPAVELKTGQVIRALNEEHQKRNLKDAKAIQEPPASATTPPTNAIAPWPPQFRDRDAFASACCVVAHAQQLHRSSRTPENVLENRYRRVGILI